MRTSPSVKSKLAKTETSIFSVMSKLAAEHQAVNLSQGFPGFDIDPKLTTLVSQAMSEGHNQYAPMPGDQGLRHVIAHKIAKMYGVEYGVEDELTITAGATQALFTAITALVGEGDEVIVFTPAYDSYVPAIQLQGGVPVFIQLKAPDFRIPWDEVKKMVNRRTRMILINSPHNPTGTVLSSDDLDELEAITHESDIIVLSDEVYEHIVFDGYKHQSVCLRKGLRDRSLMVFSFGKTFHITGWKMGYIAGPGALMDEFRKVHQFNVFSCNTPVQKALAKYMEDESNYLGLPDFYQQKRDFFLSQIKGSGFEFKPATGTYFQLLDYSKISNESDVEIAKKWTVEKQIASIPISVFYHVSLDQKLLRFCFAKEEEELIKAGRLLCEI